MGKAGSSSRPRLPLGQSSFEREDRERCGSAHAAPGTCFGPAEHSRPKARQLSPGLLSLGKDRRNTRLLPIGPLDHLQGEEPPLSQAAWGSREVRPPILAAPSAAPADAGMRKK